jgi:hypothetical protein
LIAYLVRPPILTPDTESYCEIAARSCGSASSQHFTMAAKYSPSQEPIPSRDGARYSSWK